MLGRGIFDVDHPTRKVKFYLYLLSNLVMKYMSSNKRDITEAFPSSSRRATNADWKLFDIRDDDGSETLSACPRPQDEYNVRKAPKKGEKFGESKGPKQNREPEEKDEVSGGHIEEQENEREPDEHQESSDETLGKSELPGRGRVEEQGREPVGSKESREDKTPDQDEVSEREQEKEGAPKQHRESQEVKSPHQNEDDRDKQSKLWIVPELARPTPVDTPPKRKARKIKGSLFGKMLEDSQDIMTVEDPRDSDVVIL